MKQEIILFLDEVDYSSDGLKGATCKSLSLQLSDIRRNISFYIESKTSLYCVAEISTRVTCNISEVLVLNGKLHS